MANGKGLGFLELDPENFKPGKYFLRASTNYMKNFDEDLSYVQSFRIMDRITSNNATVTVSYDLQMLPEGGHLLAEAINTVGVKLIDDSGRGINFKNAKILDEQNNVITTFKSNQFGMGKFFLSPLKGKSYRLELTTPAGNKFSQDIPQAENKGIALSSVQRENKYLVYVRTNDHTRADLNGETFYMTINNDGKLKDFEFQFPEGKNEVNISMEMDSLYAGVNTLTIFDSALNPLLERQIFSDTNLKRSRITSRMQNRGDSLIFSLQSEPKLQQASLSVSVLPGKTEAYDSKHNLLSAVYLKPYVKGAIENSTYYFSDGDRREKRHDLDLLLLTQGWSRYDWSSTFQSPQNIVKHDAGFEIKGQIVNRKKTNENKLLISSNESGLFEVVELKQDGRFELQNTYLFDDSELSFGLMQGTKVVKPSVNVTILPQDNTSGSRLANISEYKNSYNSLESLNTLPKNFMKNMETLDTVVVEADRRMDIADSQWIAGDINEISENTADRFHYLTDWLATKNFRVYRNYGQVSIRSNMLSTISAGGTDVYLYLNGTPIGTDANFISTLLTQDVESVEINRNGMGMGMNGVNGIININMKQGPRSSSSETTQTIVVNNGFTKNKEFYAPKYASYQHEIYQKYGVMDWKPALSIDENGNTRFKVLNTAQESVKLYVEGLSADGHIISEEILIE